MPQAVIAGQVAEVRTSLAAVAPCLWLTKRVKLAELPQTGLARTELAQTLARAEPVRTEPVRTELVQTELARMELAQAELV